jgi:hypothetical protein
LLNIIISRRYPKVGDILHFPGYVQREHTPTRFNITTVSDVLRLMVYSIGVSQDHEMGVICFGRLAREFGEMPIQISDNMREGIENIDKSALQAFVLKNI